MSIRILVVDDFEPWRRFVCSLIQKEPELQIICGASDGLAAVHKTSELKPDLILLDIGMPKLDGIAAARQIRDIAPMSKILFLTQESSADVMLEALRIGSGFLLKSDTYLELLPAIKVIFLDRQFVSSRLASHISSEYGFARTSKNSFFQPL